MNQLALVRSASESRCQPGSDLSFREKRCGGSYTPGVWKEYYRSRPSFTLIELLVVKQMTNYSASQFGDGYWNAW